MEESKRELEDKRFRLRVTLRTLKANEELVDSDRAVLIDAATNYLVALDALLSGDKEPST